MLSNKKIITLLAMAFATAGQSIGQQPLGLDECRQRALEANIGLKQAEAKRQQSEALEKVALWQMLPKVSANGGYMWMEKSVNLLSESQKDGLTHMGDNVGNTLNLALQSEFSDLPFLGSQIANRLSNVFSSSGIPSFLNGIGSEVVSGLETDTRNIMGGTVTLTQPIYMGGKLMAAYRAARLLNSLNGIQYDKEREATLISVDEAYWQVVSVKHKKSLAEHYASLLDTLEQNVQLAVEADMATRGDLAKVKVKRNEAQLNLTKANNGLVLAKMLLAQRCGMPLDTVYDIADEIDSIDLMIDTAITFDLEEALAHRSEMRMLRLGDSIARQGVRIASSSLKPNIIASGGYLMSNPNVFDGFSNAWGGTWIAGVGVNIPLVHIGGIYATKAAKAKRREIQYKIVEAEEMIELQITKLQSELELSYKKLTQSNSALEAAEENLLLAQESYAAGVCNSSDLMAAQTAWMQAKNEVIDAQIEIAMGKVYLKQSLGQ